MRRSARNLTPLSPSEWEVMLYCWRIGKASTHQVHRLALADGPRDYRTLQEFLRRIAVKGYLEITKVKNVNYYRPVVKKEPAVRAAIERFLDETLRNDPEHLELLEGALEKRRGRTSRRRG